VKTEQEIRARLKDDEEYAKQFEGQLFEDPDLRYLYGYISALKWVLDPDREEECQPSISVQSAEAE
jgi:hypothetical protein